MTTKAKEEWNYPFKAIPLSSISTCLQQLGIQCTKKDLQEPTPEKVSEVLRGLIEYVNPFQKLYADIAPAHPELFDDAMHEMAFQKALFSLARASLIHDFCLMDMMKPTERRLKVFLSGVINFILFRDQRVGTYETQMQRTDLLVQRKALLEDQVTTLRAQVAVFDKQREEDAPFVAKVSAEIVDLERQISELNKTQAQLQAEIRVLKTQHTDLSDRISSLKFQIADTASECERLGQNVVSSPERVQREIREMHVSMESEKAEHAKLERKSRDLSVSVKAVQDALYLMEKGVAALQQSDDEHSKYRNTIKSIKSVQATTEALQREIDDLASSESHLQRQLASSQDRLQRLQKQNELKMEASRTAVEDIRQEKVRMEREKQQQMRLTEQHEEAAAEIQNRTDAERKAHEDEMARLRLRFEDLEQNVRRYHDALMGIMDEATVVI